MMHNPFSENESSFSYFELFWNNLTSQVHSSAALQSSLFFPLLGSFACLTVIASKMHYFTFMELF